MSEETPEATMWLPSPKSPNLATYVCGNQTNPSIALIYFHGLGSHFNQRYPGLFAQHLLPSCPHVVIHGFDLSGHGRSDGERLILDAWPSHIDVCVQFVEKVRREVGDGVKLVLMGESLGGLTTAHVALRGQNVGWDVLHAIMICPAVGVNLTPLMKVQSCVGGILNLCCPKYRIVPAVRLEDMSPEESVIQDLLADPLWQHDKAPVCTALNIQKGMKIIQKPEVCASFSTPLLVIHGDADKCTSPTVSRAWFEGVSSATKKYVSIPNGYHVLTEGSMLPKLAAEVTAVLAGGR